MKAAKRPRFDAKPMQNVLQITACPACKGPYNDPRILPECLHTLCKKCIVVLAKQCVPMICPECLTEQYVNSRGIDALPVNMHIQQNINFMKKANEAEELPLKLRGDICPHVGLSKSPILCGHCSGKFCQSCLFLHNERVRMEIAWLNARLDERWNASVPKFLENSSLVERSIDQQVKSVEETINVFVDNLEQSVKQAIDQYRARLLSSARQIGEAQHQYVRSLTDKAHTPQNDILKGKLADMFNNSLLTQSSKDLCELFTKIVTQDKQIFEYETILSQPFYGQMTFCPDPTVKFAFDQISVSGQHSIKWNISNEADSGGKIPTAAWRWHKAAKAGDLQTLKKELTMMPEYFRDIALEHRDCNDSAKSALVQAAEHGRLDVVEYLCSLGANAKARSNYDDSTALHLAAENGHLGVVKFLTPLYQGLIDIDDSSRLSPLCRATFSGNADVLKYLVEDAGADVDHKGSSDQTPLIIAIEHGQLPIVEYLLSKNAKAEIGDESSVLHLAVRSGDIEICRMLSAARPDLLNALDNNGETPLHVAASRNRLDVAELLVSEFNADVDVQNKSKENALLVAVFCGSIDVSRYLREKFPILVDKCLAKPKGRAALKMAFKLLETGIFKAVDLQKLRKLWRYQQSKRDSCYDDDDNDQKLDEAVVLELLHEDGDAGEYDEDKESSSSSS